jgi:hypothetical protein
VPIVKVGILSQHTSPNQPLEKKTQILGKRRTVPAATTLWRVRLTMHTARHTRADRIRSNA